MNKRRWISLVTAMLFAVGAIVNPVFSAFAAAEMGSGQELLLSESSEAFSDGAKLSEMPSSEQAAQPASETFEQTEAKKKEPAAVQSETQTETQTVTETEAVTGTTETQPQTAETGAAAETPAAGTSTENSGSVGTAITEEITAGTEQTGTKETTAGAQQTDTESTDLPEETIPESSTSSPESEDTGNTEIIIEMVEEIAEVSVLGEMPLEESSLIQLRGSAETISAGESFTIFADIQIPDAVSCQWQIRPEGGEWTEIEGAVEAQYTFLADETSCTFQYRLVVTDAQGSRYASAAFVPVKGVTEEILETDQITLQSQPEAILAGFPFTITADIQIADASAYQWQTCTDEEEWTDIEGAEWTEYGFLADETSYGKSYRLVVTDTQGQRYASLAFKPEKAVCYVMPLARDASVSTYSQLKDAVGDGGVIYLTSDITISSTIGITRAAGTSNVTIKSDMNQPGAPFKLIRDTGDSMFSIGSTTLLGSVNLAFEDVILEGNNLEASSSMLYVYARSTLTLNNGAVVQNAKGAGAVYLRKTTGLIDNGGILTMNDGSVIQNCSAGYGGAVYINGGSPGNPGSLIVNGGSFIGNSASDSGGAIYAETNGQVSISNAVFQDNQAAYLGGAVYLTGSSSQTSFSQCTFTGNQTTGYDTSDAFNGGGAVAVVSGRKATFESCTFTQNHSATSGGAVYIRGNNENDDLGDTSVTMTGCTISGNDAGSGGGISALMKSTVTLTDVSILNNQAGSGGGIYSAGTGGEFGQATINSGTIAGNVATTGNGAGVYTGANNDVTGQGYWNALRLGSGRISIQDEVYFPMINGQIEVFGTHSLNLPRGEQIPVRIGGIPTDKESANEIGPDGNGYNVAVYPGWNTEVDHLDREEILKFRYTLDGYGFLTGRDVLELGGGTDDDTLWSNSIRVVWEDSVNEPVTPITDLYVHTQYGVDPSEDIVSGGVNLRDWGTESRPLQSIYMAYLMANQYNTADQITIHLMDTQSPGDNGLPTSMELADGFYKDDVHEVALTGANREIIFVRHDASEDIPVFTGVDDLEYENKDNQNALFRLDGADRLVLDGVAVDGKNVAVQTDTEPAAIVYLNGADASLTVSGGAVLQKNMDRAVYTEQGVATLDDAVIQGNTASSQEGAGIYQGSQAKLCIKGEISVGADQEIWLDAEQADAADGARITVSGSFTLTDAAALPVDFPNYVNRRVIASYDAALAAPDDAETGKYSVDTAKLAEAGLAVSHEGQDVLLVKQQQLSFYKYGETEDGQGKQPLAGACFWLYSLTCTTEHDHDAYVDFTKEDGCWSRTGEAVSGENGLVDFGYLGRGMYLLVEAETDYQFENPQNQWKLEIEPEAAQAEDAVKITAVQTGNETAAEFAPEQMDGVSVWTLTNTRKDGTAFSFTKIDSESKEPLSGVGFTLYYCPYSWMPGHTHEEAPTEEVLEAGVCWREAKAVSSGTDGTVDLGQIPDGTYLLKESYTKGNYYLPEGNWELTVDSGNEEEPIRIAANGDAQPEFQKGADGSYTLENTRRTDGMEFSFTKTDENGNPLNGAGFSLWRLKCMNSSHTSLDDHDHELIYPMEMGGYPTDCWEPVSLWEDGQEKTTIISGEDDAAGIATGRVDLGFLENGVYCLVENYVPFGYGDMSMVARWMWGITINSSAENLSERVTVQSLQNKMYDSGGTRSPGFTVVVNGNGTGTVAEETTVANQRGSGIPFSFYKKDADTGEAMEGVRFDLYVCLYELTTPSHQHSEMVTDEAVASGQCWMKVATAVSDSSGKVDFGELQYMEWSWESYYRLVESETLTWYELPDTQWNIEVGQNSINIEPVTPENSEASPLEFTQDDTGAYVLENEKPNVFQIDFMKVDETDVDGDGEDSPLPGASFKLYTCENTDPDHVHEELASEESARKGCWAPVQEDGQDIIYTSGEDGMVKMTLPANEYMLVETEAPPDYRLPEGQILLIVKDLGGTSYMEFQARGDDAPEYWYEDTIYIGVTLPKIANEKIEGKSFSFSKADSEDTSEFLTGAEFKIYSCNNTDPNHVHEEFASEQSEEKGCWTPIQENGEDKLFVSQGEYAMVDSGLLPYGDYMLVETKPPEGYRLPEGQWQITLEKGKPWLSTTTVKGDAPEIVQDTSYGTGIIMILLTNEKKITAVLPETGGPGTTALYFTGFALAAGTGMTFLYRRKKKNKAADGRRVIKV